jgi:hypothetical protein
MTKTELANIALGHIGSALIQSIDELSPAAQHIRRMWDLTRDGLLRQRHWNFALDRKTLTRLTDDPAFGWDAAYQLPADYLLAIEWNGREAGTGEAEFDIEGGKLLCDDTETAELRYVKRVEEVSKWDASFCEAFCYKLAAAIAPSLSSSQGMADALTAKGEQSMLRAFGPDNLETRPRAVLAQEGSQWRAAREGALNW